MRFVATKTPEQQSRLMLHRTDGQTLDAQQATLKAAGADRLYSEKIGGAGH
jgi:hypothetical protein